MTKEAHDILVFTFTCRILRSIEGLTVAWQLHPFVQFCEAKMNSSDKNTLVVDLLTYLLNNQDAGDTLEGIARLWILRQRLDLMVREVEAVLDELVAKGLLIIESLPAPDGVERERYYRLPPGRKDEVLALLEKLRAENMAAQSGDKSWTPPQVQ